MFKLGKQVETALIALKDLHENPEGVSVSSIAEKKSLSKNTLSKLLQNLMNKGFLLSAQGIRGGYKLVCPIEEISFYDLLIALNEIKPLTCTTKVGCAFEKQCSIKSPLQCWENRFLNFLKETSIKDLVVSSSQEMNSNPLSFNFRSLEA